MLQYSNLMTGGVGLYCDLLGTTTLPLEVFTQRNFVANFIQLKLNFIFLKQKIAFEPPFGGLRGNVRTQS